MEILTHKYRRKPNEKIDAIYSGVALGGRTVTTIVRPSADGNRMEKSRVYGPGMPRGAGGQVAVLILGGMETTLDEMEYILEAQREKTFVPRRRPQDIVAMCRMLIERRNILIKRARVNPSEFPRPKKRRVRMHLPVGYRMVQSSVPGVRLLGHG